MISGDNNSRHSLHFRKQLARPAHDSGHVTWKKTGSCYMFGLAAPQAGFREVDLNLYHLAELDAKNHSLADERCREEDCSQHNVVVYSVLFCFYFILSFVSPHFCKILISHFFEIACQQGAH